VGQDGSIGIPGEKVTVCVRACKRGILKSVLDLPLASCVTMGKSLNLSVLEFPLL
jgi:hypothetical protein